MPDKSEYPFLLNGVRAESLYESVRGLPIIDYHCHLSAKDIYEDIPFRDIGQIWLANDHYKWRLTRSSGIDERYITGDACAYDKFERYIEALETAVHTPLSHWSAMELKKYFDISIPLKKKNAREIWETANSAIAQRKLSPRKLILSSNVEYIATTDDIADNLEWHEKLKNDPNFNVTVTPSFRADRLLLIRRDGFLKLIGELESFCRFKIHGIEDYMKAISCRLDYFVKHGCLFTDVGIDVFPNSTGSLEKSGAVFFDALNGKKISEDDFHLFLGFMFSFLGEEYKKRGLVMQWHLGAMRNVNSVYYDNIGTDCGGDCVGDPIPGKDIAAILNRINSGGGLPRTIIYSLNPSMREQVASIAGAFPHVCSGAAWWFCDHLRGIREQLDIIAEYSNLGKFFGMLTDSRSFSSYVRHDYFRMILCGYLDKLAESGETDYETALKVAYDVCYGNISRLVNRSSGV